MMSRALFSTRHQRWVQHIGTLGIMILLSVIATWPLIANLGTVVLGPPQDNYYYLSWFAWLRHTILDLQQPTTFNPHVFYPFGHDFNTSETTWANVALTLPALLIWDEVVAYNLAVLLSFMLSGLGMYILVFELTGEWLAALLSGIIYAFSPYRFAHLGGGQLPLLGTQWLPLCLWSIERTLREKRWSWGLAAGLFFALTALSSWYYAFMAGLLLPVYVLVRARPWRHYLQSRAIWLALAGAAGVAGALILPAILPTLRLSRQAGMSYSLQWVDRWSASPVDYLLPNPVNTFWGRLTTKFYAGQRFFYERILSLGWVPLGLAFLGLKAPGAPRPWPKMRTALLWLGGIALVLSLGTTLHIRDVEPLHIPVPGDLDQAFTRLMFNWVTRYGVNDTDYHWAYEQPGHIVLPLPAMLLYLYMPFSNAMRVWSRFGLFVMLVVAILAGKGLVWLIHWLQPHSRHLAAFIGMLALALVLLEFAVVPFPYGLSEVEAQPATSWLAERTSVGAIMELPLSRAMNGPPLYASTLHGRNIAYGYGTFFPPSWLTARKKLEAFPAPEALETLRAWDVRYVLLAAKNYQERWPQIKDQSDAAPELRLVGIFEEKELYHHDRWFLSTRGTALPFVADTIYVYELLPAGSTNE